MTRSIDERISRKVSVTTAVLGLALVGLYVFGPTDEQMILYAGIALIGGATGVETLRKRRS